MRAARVHRPLAGLGVLLKLLRCLPQFGRRTTMRIELWKASAHYSFFAFAEADGAG